MGRKMLVLLFDQDDQTSLALGNGETEQGMVRDLCSNRSKLVVAGRDNHAKNTDRWQSCRMNKCVQCH